MFVGIANPWDSSAGQYLPTEYCSLPVLGQLDGGKAPHQRVRRARHRCKKIHSQCCAHARHTQAEDLPENAGAGSGIVTRNSDHTLAMHSRAQGRRQRKAGNDGLRIGICADTLGPQHTRNIRCDYKGHQHNQQLIPQIE